MMFPFPFVGEFQLGMGIKPLSELNPFVVCSQAYPQEIALKRKLLAEDRSYCFKAFDSSEAAQWEAVELIGRCLTQFYPSQFHLHIQGDTWHWENSWLHEQQTFVFGNTASLGLDPLDWVGRQVQEDLLLLDASAILVAGQLCFPSGWALDEKMGNNFLELHGPLPEDHRPMLAKASLLMERIVPGKQLQRDNWGLRVSPDLDLSTRHAMDYTDLLARTVPSLRPQNVLEKIFLRIEHQTLTRLPDSRHVLFTVHTEVSNLQLVLDSGEKKEQMACYLQTVPKAILKYKQIEPFYGQLVEGLQFRE